MKKFMLLFWMIFFVGALTGCNHKEGVINEDVLSNDGSGMIELSCADTIKQYLDDADMEGLWDDVSSGQNVTVHYVGRLNAEDVFDTSVEVVAKACGTYNPNRNYEEGLTFKVGAGQMIAGFDDGVQGMKLGQTKTITIPAAEAYGEWTEEALVTVDRAKIPNADELKVWMEVANSYGQKLKVQEITDTSVVLDGNHELAGKDLIFDITILEIN